MRAVRFLLSVGAIVLGALGISAPIGAQVPIGDLEAGYASASLEYTRLLEDRERTFTRYEQALDRVDAARGTGDEAQRARAHASFQVVAFELMELELAVEQASGRLDSARGAYLEGLSAQEEELLEALGDDRALTPTAEARLLEEWREVRARASAVRAESVSAETLALRPVPELAVDPRDGPVESLEKARFMEEQALSYDSLIVDLDAQIDGLERQLQQLQSVQDLLRDVGRFGTDFVQGDPPGLGSVTGAPDGDGGGVVAGETGAERLAQLPVAEQLSLVRGARNLAVQYRAQALAQAQIFRERAEGMRP